MNIESISSEYDNIVGMIYSGPLEDEPWQSFLPQLRDIMKAKVVSLILRPPSSGDAGVILNCLRLGMSADKDDSTELANPNDWQVTTYKEQFFSLDPFVNLPPGKVVTLEELVPGSELVDSEYYHQYLKPVDVFHVLGADTIEPNGLIARLRISRGREEAPFSEQDKLLCSKLLPHLRRAIQIHARLNQTASERDLYAGTVNQMSVAAIILDEKGNVLKTNAIAEQLLAERDGISLINNQLTINRSRENDTLKELIQMVIQAQLQNKATLARALRITRPSGNSDYGLVVRPVPSSEWADGQSSPSAAVFISDPDLQASTSQQVLSDLYDLTPAETNLALHLARGLSLAEASEVQKISQHTARAQLKSIFSKTQVTRQAELVRLILKSVATLA